MSLTLRYFKVKKVQFGETTSLLDGTLTINKYELQQVILEDPVIADIDIEIVQPGESARIIHVMDAVEPRIKVGGAGGVYPGMTGPINCVGEGVTNVLQGAAVIQTGQRQGVQEGIIDMTGSGAGLSVFSQLCNIVLIPKLIENVGGVEFDQSMRIAGFKAAEYLAKVTLDTPADSEELFDLTATGVQDSEQLPRIAYVYHLQSQGLLRNTFIYGQEALHILPTLINPTEIFDGAVVSSNYIIACQKNPTYFHVNNPVVLDLARRHGKDLIFAGVILANEHSTLADKSRSASYAAKLAKFISAAGVIITQEGGGHADTDLMMVCKECETSGIKSVIIANEVAGPEGELPSLVDTVPEAVAIVSTGNNDELVTLDSVERVVGEARFLAEPNLPMRP
ncbi:glycine/sarcosine/betaine reductase component B subunit [Desulfosporosinus sp. SB140]|uniref:glycine/sarcosine/betaine reductase component B subunit n=1 Tax=Desulfosporosinus paludis TaxID=3115649 RepID=UPI0038911856